MVRIPEIEIIEFFFLQKWSFRPLQEGKRKKLLLITAQNTIPLNNYNFGQLTVFYHSILAYELTGTII